MFDQVADHNCLMITWITSTLFVVRVSFGRSNEHMPGAPTNECKVPIVFGLRDSFSDRLEMPANDDATTDTETICADFGSWYP